MIDDEFLEKGFEALNLAKAYASERYSPVNNPNEFKRMVDAFMEGFKAGVATAQDITIKMLTAS